MSENRHFGVYAYLFKIEKSQKNKHSHMFDIASIIFLVIPKSLGELSLSDSLLVENLTEKEFSSFLSMPKITARVIVCY